MISCQVELQALLLQPSPGGIPLQGSAHMVVAMPRGERGAAQRASRPVHEGLVLGWKARMLALWGMCMQQAPHVAGIALQLGGSAL